MFLLLEIGAIGAFIRSHDESRARSFAKIHELSFAVYNWRHGMSSYFGLRTENELLREENALLKSVIYGGRNTFRPSSLEEFDVLGSEIIMMTTKKQRNYFTLDKGSLDGVEAEMGVISRNGIMGKVSLVTEHYALCKSVLHKDIKISVSLEDSLYFGSLGWDGKNPRILQLEDIPSYAQPEIGEKIYTNSFSSLFPSGIEVGEIIMVEKASGSNYYAIEVKLINELARSGTAYVFRNTLLDERNELEENVLEDE